MELIITLGLIGMLTTFGASQKSALFTFASPFEKIELRQRIHLAQARAITRAQPQFVPVGNREIYFGPSGLPKPGSSGRFQIIPRSGRKLTLVLSSMGRSRIE